MKTIVKSILDGIRKAFLRLINFINPKIGDIRVLFPIGIKLVVFFALVLFTVLALINGLMAGRASKNLEVTALTANSSVNSLVAVETESRLYSIRKDVYLLLDFMRLAGADSQLSRQAADVFFERSFFIAAIYVQGFTELINNQFLVSGNVNYDSVISWFSRQTEQIQDARQGKAVIANPTAELGTPLLAMFYPWQQDNSEEAVVILFSPGALAEIFDPANYNSFIASPDGELLFHSDYRKLIGSSRNVSDHPLFSAFSKTGARDIQLVYTENRVKYFGAGKIISLGDLAVFTYEEYELPFKATAALFRRNIFLIISAVFVSVIFVWFMSKTITVPVHRLVEAVSLMKEGQFEIKLKYRFPDEIGVLSQKFIAMGKSLAIREKSWIKVNDPAEKYRDEKEKVPASKEKPLAAKEKPLPVKEKSPPAREEPRHVKEKSQPVMENPQPDREKPHPEIKKPPAAKTKSRKKRAGKK